MNRGGIIAHGLVEHEVEIGELLVGDSGLENISDSYDVGNIVQVLEYRKEMPNGGTREMTVTEHGKVELSGRDPNLELLTGRGKINYETTFASLDEYLDYRAPSFSELRENALEENYMVFDNLILGVEDEAEISGRIS